MKKIPTIFLRDFGPESKGRLVTREPHPDCLWVFAGEGTPTRKLDGTCCLIDDKTALYKRREVKKDQQPPEGFVVEGVDEQTGKTVGWVPVEIDDPTNQWHIEAFNNLLEGLSLDEQVPELMAGTYELVGPKIQGNPEGYVEHVLFRHDDPGLVLQEIGGARTYNAIMTYLANASIEGIVYHHPDGRMAKIKTKDFGLPRKPL